MYTFLDVLLEDERELLKLLISPLNVLFNSCDSQCQQDVGGSQYKLPAPGSPEGGPEPNYVTCVFVLFGSIIIYSL